MKVGAHYCSLWWQDADGIAPHYMRALGTPQQVDWRTLFPKRQPVFGWLDNAQSIMDQQIQLAAANAIDFFCFCWFATPKVENWPGSINDNNGLTFFRASPNKGLMQFCVNYVADPNHVITDINAWNQAVDFWISCFSDPQYLRVNHKPVFIIDAAGDFAKLSGQAPNGGSNAWMFLGVLRDRAKAAGFPGLMIGGCLSSPADVPTAMSDGFDFVVGDYASCGTIPKGAETPIDYATLLTEVPPWWASFGQTGVKYAPCVCSGFDRRPLGLNPPEAYLTNVTPILYQKLLNAARNYLGVFPGVGLVFTYAWNEIGEGGKLAPDITNGNMLVAQIAAVFG